MALFKDIAFFFFFVYTAKINYFPENLKISQNFPQFLLIIWGYIGIAKCYKHKFVSLHPNVQYNNKLRSLHDDFLLHLFQNF